MFIQKKTISLVTNYWHESLQIKSSLPFNWLVAQPCEVQYCPFSSFTLLSTLSNCLQNRCKELIYLESGIQLKCYYFFKFQQTFRRHIFWQRKELTWKLFFIYKMMKMIIYFISNAPLMLLFLSLLCVAPTLLVIKKQ